jgi:circadian clock protein KaiB
MPTLSLPPARYRFRLFVAGMSPRSVSAIANARALFDRCLAGAYDLEVADVTHKPEWVTAAELIALPTLVRLEPGPVKKVVGDLSNAARALSALDLPEPAELRGVR